MHATQTPPAAGLYAHLVDDLRGDFLTNAELAKIAGVKTRQVQHWAAGTHRPQGQAKDRLLELHYTLERLRDVYTVEGADIWVHGRNRDLDGETPIDLLGAGQFERVLAAVEHLSAGTM